MMAAYLYSVYMIERLPDPIFLDEQLLLRVVLNAVRDHLDTNTDSPQDLRDLPISGMKRLEDGGISVTVHYVGAPISRNGAKIREDKTWYVEADCWGRLNKVEEKSLRVSQIAEEKAEAEEPKKEEKVEPEDVFARVRRLVETETRLKVRRFESLPDGSISLTLTHPPTF
jgi:hypothetical protein